MRWRPFARLRARLTRITRRRIAAALMSRLYATGLYRATLSARTGGPFEHAPSEPWPGDSNLGAAVIAGRFALAGQTLAADGDGAAAPWDALGVTDAYRAALHGFDWLRDVRAAGGDAARLAARRIIDDWIAREAPIRAVPWRADVLASRIAAWLAQSEYLWAGANDEFRAHFEASLARQARHLARAARYAPDDANRIVIFKALIYAALAMPASRRRLARWIAQLDRAIAMQVLADGGHVERSPEVHLAALRHLVDIRANLREAGLEVPASLQGAIDRMAPMLRFFRHGDGGLVQFNDSSESRDWLIDMVLTHADARGKPLASAPHTGFERLAASRTLLVVDAGAPPPPGLDLHAHAGTLAFEMSVGKERMVVNCGAYVGPNAAWRDAQRATAAHSTLVVEDVNSSELLPGGGLGLRPRAVTVERRESDGSVWIDAAHDGYVRLFGLTHRRRLYLSSGGDDLRGEDTLTGRGHHKFAVRFHLHPLVKASLVQRGSSVLLRLGSGAGWHLRATGGVTNLQESVYLGPAGEVRRTDQIVISAATKGDGAQIKWAFTRVPA
ncbi:MAG TPA: heparinase II/III family protein [Alphaproteobacteria bacterium]